MFTDNGEGEISAELEDTVQSICDDVAHVPDNDLGDLRDGEESDYLDDVLKDSFHQTQTKNMFRSVMLVADGYVDDLVLRLAARHLKMEGLRVVSVIDGVLVKVDRLSEELPDTDALLVLHDGGAHFEALIPWTSVSTDRVTWRETRGSSCLPFIGT